MALLWIVGTIVAAIISSLFLLKGKRKKHEVAIRALPTNMPFSIMNIIVDSIRDLTQIDLIPVKRAPYIKAAEDLASSVNKELWGSQDDYVEGLKAFLNGVNDRDIRACGRFSLNRFLTNLLNCRSSTMKYIEQHPEIHQKRLNKPLIITGLPRTGSTFLYNLLACDPASRAPRFFELTWMTTPFPPTTKETFATDPRIQECAEKFKQLEAIYPKFFQYIGESHRSHPTEIEEEVLVMMHSFCLQLHEALSSDEYRKWYERDDNKEFAYRYLRLFLQMLNEKWEPPSHWVLKAPIHSTWLNQLAKEFPDARLVFTHREAKSVVPSWCRLIEGYSGLYYADYTKSRTEFSKFMQDSLLLCANRLLSFRKTADPKQYIDIRYKDLTSDPIGTVKKIYQYFDIQFTDEFEQNMKEWIKNNRQGKFGRAHYTLEEYGLSEKGLAETFSEYHKLLSDNQ